MQPLTICFYSPVALESWDWDTPLTRGIGGSETAHVELVRRIKAQNPDTHVISLAPISENRIVDGVDWRHIACLPQVLEMENVAFFNFRHSEFYARELPPSHKQIFVAQDVGYTWAPEWLDKVDLYVCLCSVHAGQTAKTLPPIADRIEVSTNGIRSSMISGLADLPPRNPKKMIWASSPDRGLLFILEQWFRIREAEPEAELHIFYGMENMEKILAAQNGQAWFLPMKQSIEKLLNQPGITWRGRISQAELYREWFSSGVWFYPTDWPETSCIACMEAQACGAVPVTNGYWAIRDNVQHGVRLDGVPQQDRLLAANMVRECIRMLQDAETQEQIRGPMMEWAREKFDWDVIARQYIEMAQSPKLPRRDSGILDFTLEDAPVTMADSRPPILFEGETYQHKNPPLRMIVSPNCIGTISRAWLRNADEKFIDSWEGLLLFNSRHLENWPQTYVHYTKGKLSWHSGMRNDLARSMRGDWLLMVDTDHCFQPDLAMRLLTVMDRHEADVLCGIYQYRNQPHTPVACVQDPSKEEYSLLPFMAWGSGNEVEPVATAGAGCMLIRRHVIEKIWDLGQEPFDPIGTLSEDYSFCKRANDLGLKVMLALNIECHHVVSQVLSVRSLPNHR